MYKGLPEYDRVEGGCPLLVVQSFRQILVMSVLLEKESMSYTPAQIADLAVTLTQENLDQIKAKSAKYGLPWEDGRQEFSLIILDKGKEFDPTRGTLCQFIFGHWEKQRRRQIGAHTFAVSFDHNGVVGEEARTRIENMTVSAYCDDDDMPYVSEHNFEAEILALARLLSGMSTSEIAQLLEVTPRRVRQMLQQLREKRTISERLKLLLKKGR